MESLVRAAFKQATAHGHHWVGAEHLLLALVKEPPGSPARQALVACGVSEMSVGALLSRLPVESGDHEGASPNARFYGIRGRAQGFAIRDGKAYPTGEEFLLAVIWEPQGFHTAVFNDLGLTSSALQAALAAQGVHVPDCEPPPFDPPRRLARERPL